MYICILVTAISRFAAVFRRVFDPSRFGVLCGNVYVVVGEVVDTLFVVIYFRTGRGGSRNSVIFLVPLPGFTSFFFLFF